MKVRWNSNALREFADILHYISERNPSAATRFVSKVSSTVNLIAAFPELGKKTALENARRVVVGRYILVYELTQHEAIISYFRHGSRKRPWEND